MHAPIEGLIADGKREGLVLVFRGRCGRAPPPGGDGRDALLVEVHVDGRTVWVPPGTTILEAARRLGVTIPALCHLPGVHVGGMCGICVVEVEGRPGLVTACDHEVYSGMTVNTSSPAVKKAREAAISALFEGHPRECLICERKDTCELRELERELGAPRLPGLSQSPAYGPDRSTAAIVRNPAKCVLCGRCFAVCSSMGGLDTLAAFEGPAAQVADVVEAFGQSYPLSSRYKGLKSMAFSEALGSTDCTQCGQCVLACPTAALTEKPHIGAVARALADPRKHVVVQTAPSLRVTVAEFMGLDPGSISTGQLVAALRRLGFDRVFDTAMAADITVVEETAELAKRLSQDADFPMFSSCCPAWVKYVEDHYPEIIPALSTCKSPQQMFGAVAKTYYAQVYGIDPDKVYAVSVMPCTAKKYEAARPELTTRGRRDVDAVLTARELARMLQANGIDLGSLEPEDYDMPLGHASGGGTIFGAGGGVMEAVVRVFRKAADADPLEPIEWTAHPQIENVQEAAIKVPGRTLRVAAVQTLRAARALISAIKDGAARYDFVEVMACPGGCVGGGGQPIPMDKQRLSTQPGVRGMALRRIDPGLGVRVSSDNPWVARVMEFLGGPLSGVAEEVLHTCFTAREDGGPLALSLTPISSRMGGAAR